MLLDGGAWMRAQVIVVTGGIASGKSTVSKAMAGKDGVWIDCDVIAHEVLNKSDAIARIVRVFGKRVLTPQRRISRKKLGRIVFSDRRELEKLNGLIKPFLKRRITDEVMSVRSSSAYIVLDAVLFFQYKFRFKVDGVVWTTAPFEVRLERLMRRDGISRDEAAARIVLHENLVDDWKRADYIINTDRPIDRVERDAVRVRDEILSRSLHSRKRKITNGRRW
ncbi:dephospho-CoA kinase [bacterium]|nr:MAG: dephospho-CoA kinase [bacterium]